MNKNFHKDRENGLFLRVNGNFTSKITSVVSVIHFSCFIQYLECVVTLNCNFI